jgi:hypothetical protein
VDALLDLHLDVAHVRRGLRRAVQVT